MPSKFVQYVHQHPPRCVANVNAKPTQHFKPTLRLPGHLSIYYEGYGEGDIAGVDTASFIIGCPCNCRTVYLLGYCVTAEGHREDTYFGVPLSIECTTCGAISEFFDTREHGRDGEQGCNTHRIGVGKPDRFACPHCGEAPGIVCVNFSYQGVEDFDDEMLERKQDFFNTLDVVVQCMKCNALIEVTSFECD